MPELPDATRTRLQKLGLSERDIDVLMTVDSGRELGYDGKLGHGAVAYFDKVASGRDPKVVINWIIHELLGQHVVRSNIGDNPMSLPDGDASLEKLCAEAVEAFPEEARSVRSGKINVVNVILGRVMKASRGTVDAKAARTTLLRMLKP
ncbi:hypothetical protein PHLCEN_2v10705 [Hermanssonia centrifuga]|uniref:Asn/Gln amidotransferase domain-containing protein n=1 Tax=Hermanssonia centrifuga TaxID=98765 RepID=A0A2R6NLZ4_9APHY|nr:hypothetical protein PHLCEN_2v10705 [Hermanssonia centrifuga]